MKKEQTTKMLFKEMWSLNIPVIILFVIACIFEKLGFHPLAIFFARISLIYALVVMVINLRKILNRKRLSMHRYYIISKKSHEGLRKS